MELNMNDEIEKVYEEFWWHIKMTRYSEYVVNYQVRHLISYDPLLFTDKDLRPTENIKESEMYLSGSIKWDGCSHNTFGAENGYIHGCTREEMKNLSKLFDILFDMAIELIGHEEHLK
jgi:hypothetical protein